MRTSGVLMHLSSLPSDYGIGSMGKPAFSFVDFLKEAKQSVWQILPICPTSYGDSPYQSFSTYAGNPYFIDLEKLEEDGLLKPEEYQSVDWESTPSEVNYDALYRKRYPVLHMAVSHYTEEESYQTFLKENAFWLNDYALFMALKDAHNGAPWYNWEEDIKLRKPDALIKAQAKYADDIHFWKVIQYLFYQQWNALKQYANSNGIQIFGDLPIYVAYDSVDVWAHPSLFQLDENNVPKEVAGCPPDGFSAAGQLWGNPLYNWEKMKEDHYAWWVERIDYLTCLYDILRIDHFRGFDSYYAIPYGNSDARIGEWRKGPGIALFKAIEEKLGQLNIVAEDLGFLTDSVRQLLKDSGYPGMRVLELGFDARDTSGSIYLPHNFINHCVAYAGTHDNDTISGWLNSASEEDVAYAKEYLRLTKEEGYVWGMLKALWRSVADMTIVQAQDLLELDSSARMNTPSTLGNNWKWRATAGSFTEDLAKKIARETQLSGR